MALHAALEHVLAGIGVGLAYLLHDLFGIEGWRRLLAGRRACRLGDGQRPAGLLGGMFARDDVENGSAAEDHQQGGEHGTGNFVEFEPVHGTVTLSRAPGSILSRAPGSILSRAPGSAEPWRRPQIPPTGGQI